MPDHTPAVSDCRMWPSKAIHHGRLSISRGAFLRLTSLRRRALNELLNQYLALDSAVEQASFVGRIGERYPRLARWFVPLAQESRTTTSLFTRSPAPIAEGLLDSEDPPPSPDLEPGARLGPWRIHSYVGAGGMGKVYRGERADDAFEMDVAIKLIGSRRSALADHLRHECQLLARLDDPGVTRLIDAGVTDEDEPFLVMEWVEGEDLELWLGEHIDLEARLNLFREVAEAVAHAHQRLIVHGDIKPGNIRITPEGRVKLMDFGVARLLEGDAGKPGGITALTPAFAAPEQIEGEETTPTSDVWALGALLNWLLTGAAIRQSEKASLADAFPGQSSRCQELSAIIDKACAHAPDDRYTTVAGLLDDLERFREHYPVRAHAPDRGYRTRKFVRRNPVMIGGLAATFASLVGGLIVAGVLYVEAESARQQASVEQQRAEGHAEELEQVVRFQSEQLSEIDTEAMGFDLRLATLDQLDQAVTEAELSEADSEQFHALAGGLDYTGMALDLFGAHVFDRALDTIDEQFEDQPLLAARLLQTLADTLHHLDQYERSMDLVRQALALRQGLLGDDHPDTLSSVAALGRLFRDTGEYELARERLDQALNGRHRVLGEDHPDTLESQGDLASLLSVLGHQEEAETLFRQILAVRQERLGENHPDTAEVLNNIGRVMHEGGRMPEAEAYYRQSLEILESVLGPTHSRTLKALNNLGYLLTESGRYETGVEVLEQHLERSRRVFGADHPRTLRGHHNIAHGLQNLGDLQAAQAHYRKAYEGRLRVYGDNHRLTLYSLSGLGHVLMGQGEFEQAISYFREAADISENVLGPTHRITFMTHHNLANVFARAGDHDKALMHATHAVDGLVQHTAGDHFHVLLTRHNKAGILAELGRLDESLGYGLLAWGVGHRLFGPWHPHTRRTLNQIIETHDLRTEEQASGPRSDPVMISFWKLHVSLEENASEE